MSVCASMMFQDRHACNTLGHMLEHDPEGPALRHIRVCNKPDLQGTLHTPTSASHKQQAYNKHIQWVDRRAAKQWHARQAQYSVRKN
jgi:hypothetical protein